MLNYWIVTLRSMFPWLYCWDVNALWVPQVTVHLLALDGSYPWISGVILMLLQFWQQICVQRPFCYTFIFLHLMTSVWPHLMGKQLWSLTPRHFVSIYYFHGFISYQSVTIIFHQLGPVFGVLSLYRKVPLENRKILMLLYSLKSLHAKLYPFTDKWNSSSDPQSD